jgi:hypothetical protein
LLKKAPDHVTLFATGPYLNASPKGESKNHNLEAGMKKTLVLAAVMAMTFLTGRVFADDMSHSEMHNGTTMGDKAMGKSMKCEVIDVACYMAKGAHGEAHQACAAKCISGGGELALLYNGKLYIPVDKTYHSVRDQFVTKGGEMVTVTGTTVSKAGLNYMVLSDSASSSPSGM